MRVKRCSNQDNDSLEEFYQKINENEAYDRTGVGAAMLQLLGILDSLFKETQIWGLTSHSRLILQSANDSASEWYVTISSIGHDYYFFEYLLPANKRPWSNAQVRGETQSLADAERYLLIAMRESEGWVGNDELDKLLAERNL